MGSAVIKITRDKQQNQSTTTDRIYKQNSMSIFFEKKNAQEQS